MPARSWSQGKHLPYKKQQECSLRGFICLGSEGTWLYSNLMRAAHRFSTKCPIPTSGEGRFSQWNTPLEPGSSAQQLRDGSGTPMSCCFSFQFQHTFSSVLLTLPVRGKIRKQLIPQGLSIAQEEQRNKGSSMTQCSVRTVPPDHSEGETKSHFAPVLSVKRNTKNIF